MATDIRDEEFTDDQAYFHRFIVCASHAVEEISEIWFDDKQAWTAAGGVQGEFVGYMTVAVREEGAAGNAINISARMGATRRYTGLAYVHLRYKLTGNSSKAESPFAQSITTRITIRGKGAALYDPREDDTVAGGEGDQRADDQDTWLWDDDGCRNPALALLFYLLGYRINDLLAIGKGIPPERIDLESFAIAANICDEEVDDGDGGTEPRYRCDGVWSEADSPSTVMDALKACMNADLDDVDGKLRLTVFHNDLATPETDFTDDDVLGAFFWEAAPALDQTFNIVRGTYTDPSDTSLYQQVEYPEVSSASPDGIDRISPVDFPMVQSASQAQRLAQMRLMRNAYGGTFKAEFQATAWKVQKNSVVRLTFAATGFTTKLFRVAEMDIRVDGVVPLTLREEHADIYGAPTIELPAAPVASTPYDPSLNPWLEQINTTLQLLIASSYVTDADPADGLIQATESAGTVTVVIENHSRTYTDIGSISVTGDSLTEDENSDPLVVETAYHLAYDDPDRAGGAVTIVAYLDSADAATSGANPARHYIGTIITPAVAGSTSSGGATPGGWQAEDYYCVADDTPILLADGREQPARDLTVGTMLRTQDETTLEWGDHPVLAISFADEPVLACRIGDVTIEATARHRFHIDGRWVRAEEIGIPCGVARVAKITVADAHTYVSAGVLSHNVKP